jgi:hypothetical protein
MDERSAPLAGCTMAMARAPPPLMLAFLLAQSNEQVTLRWSLPCKHHCVNARVDFRIGVP